MSWRPALTHPAPVLLLAAGIGLAGALAFLPALRPWSPVALWVLIWGLLHGGYLIGERLLALRRPLPPPDRWPRRWQWLGGLAVFSLTLLAWVPFREGAGLGETLTVWSRLVDVRGWTLADLPGSLELAS